MKRSHPEVLQNSIPIIEAAPCPPLYKATTRIIKYAIKHMKTSTKTFLNSVNIIQTCLNIHMFEYIQTCLTCLIF